MVISILSIFPEICESIERSPVIACLGASGSLVLEWIDIKDFAGGSFRHIDDSPYGGGAGMILRCQPVLDALEFAKVRHPELDHHSVLLAPIGHVYQQKDARRLAACEHLILICSHYEGFDARVYDYVDELISIGDYILTGGELAAMVLLDSVTRLTKGALREESTREESFENGLLEYPQYTRPAVFDGKAVPEVLLSGNHEAIRRWRREESEKLTRRLRPDLVYPLEQ